MAARVNTKFVVILSGVVLVLAAGVVAAGYVAMKGRGERDVQKGDVLMAQGKVREAAGLYERSVGRDRTRQDWLEKWLGAMVQIVPEKRAEYEEKYTFYRGILRQLAVLRPTDADAQTRYIKEFDAFVRAFGATREGLERVIVEAEDRAKQLRADDAATQRLMRFRGLAQCDRMALIVVAEEDRRRAMADLRSACAADPADWESRLAIVRWHLAEVDRVSREGRKELVEGEQSEARQEIEAFLQEHPGHPEGMLTRYLMTQSDRLRRVSNALEVRAAAQDLAQEARRLIEATAGVPASELSAEHVDRLASVTMRVLGPDGLGPLQELVSRVLKERPSEATLLLTQGVLLQQKGLAPPAKDADPAAYEKQVRQDCQAAIDQFQRVVDLPDLPVGLAGLQLPNRRLAAQAFQVDTALQMWNTAAADDQRAKALATAKQYRDALDKNIGVRGKDLLLLRDAKIAMAERHLDEAVRKLSELHGKSGAQSLEVLQLLAQALDQQQNRGEARRVLEELLTQAPGVSWAHARLAEIHIAQNRVEDAAGEYTRALELEPDNQAYKARLAALRTATGKVEPGDTKDPVISAVMDSRRLREEGRLSEARSRVDEARKGYPKDSRLLIERVQIDMRDAKKDDALAVVKEALAASPDDRQLQAMKTRLEIDDPVKAGLAIIEAADATPLVKALERFQVYLDAGKNDEARAALKEAEGLEPDNARVLDLTFLMALTSKDFPTAQRIAERAAKLNIDQMQGLLYQGRMELVQGKDRDAVASFERAVKEVPYNPGARRLLGQAYMKVGRIADAVAAFERAFEGRPEDVATARDYAQALLTMNRGKEALEVIGPAKGALRYAPTDEGLIRLWLSLETQYGDRARALKVRQGLFQSKAGDFTNASALAQLLMEDQKWDEAKAVITKLEADPDGDKLSVATMWANWWARQGDIDAGKKAIEGYIAGLPKEKLDSSQHLLLGEYLIRVGRADDGLAAMEQARQFQNPKLMQADRRLGDYHFDQAGAAQNAEAAAKRANDEKVAGEQAARATELFGKAAERYQLVLKTMTEPADVVEAVRKRTAETYLRVEKIADAQRVVEQLAKEQPDDLQVLLLQSALAQKSGDRRTARQRLDRAVEVHPSDPTTFLQRAIFNMNDAAFTADALQDFEHVVRLRPGAIGAWVYRYNLYKRNKQMNEAFAVLRSGIDANRDDIELRFLLVRELAAAGRGDEAQAEVLNAVNDRKDDMKWLATAARLMAQSERWKDSADLYGRLYKKQPSPEVAAALLDSQLRPGSTPSKPEVASLLGEFEKIASKAALGDLLLRARAKVFLDPKDAKKEVAGLLNDALGVAGEDGESGKFFFTQLVLLKGGVLKDAFAFLEEKAKAGPLNPYLAITRVSGKLAGGEAASGLLEEAKQIEPRAKDDLSRLELFRLLGRMYYSTERFQESADADRQALEIKPDDAELNNNLAYCLVSDLNDAAAGLPYAEKAAGLIPESSAGHSTVMDTLGWAYFKVRKFKEASGALSKAVETASTAEDSFVALLHLGLTQVELGEKAAARRTLGQTEEAAGKVSAGVKQTYTTLLESLRKASE